MKHIGNGRMIASNDKKLRAWRLSIVDAIHKEMFRIGVKPFFDTALQLDIKFCVERPKSVKRIHPTVPYDLDKLIRAVGDGCTQSGLISDDAIFVDISAVKRYSDGCPY
ncbi:RusA family crossover junction endodeoxyribonuclease, partial [Pantoea sp. ANP04]|uniref:RusA family crossover junction endodeoxyribonuclease n=1 Tax=Pantoea sp. ANP04 TaxID=3064896 RepID=UPI0035C5C9C3